MKGIVQLSSVGLEVSDVFESEDWSEVEKGWELREIRVEVGGKHTIFDSILQLQRLPRLITYREGYLLKLILLIRDMFARITVSRIRSAQSSKPMQLFRLSFSQEHFHLAVLPIHFSVNPSAFHT